MHRALRAGILATTVLPLLTASCEAVAAALHPPPVTGRWDAALEMALEPVFVGLAVVYTLMLWLLGVPVYLGLGSRQRLQLPAILVASICIGAAAAWVAYVVDRQSIIAYEDELRAFLSEVARPEPGPLLFGMPLGAMSGLLFWWGYCARGSSRPAV